MIDITLFFIVKQAQYDLMLQDMGIILNESNYFNGLILSNIFAYLVILLFAIALMYVLRRVKRMIRRAFA